MPTIREAPVVRTGTRGKVVANVILGVGGLVWVLPVLFALIGSMKTKQEYSLTAFWDLPGQINWLTNFVFIQEHSNILQSMANSLMYALFGTIGAMLFAAISAFGVTTLRIKHPMLWFMIIYSGTIFPFQVYLIPVLSAYQHVGLYDTKLGLILFYMAICTPFAMFVMRNFFQGISRELVEAARMDGASDFRILLRIFIPMSMAPLSVVFMTQFAWCYNELMFGITFIKSNDVKPVMATLSTFTGNTPAMLVACGIVSVPTILIYALLNRNFNTGMAYHAK